MKSGTHFHFKKFSVAQDRTAHKIGTDGVLLGAWVNMGEVHHILDIGTGTGVIALMLAQRSGASVRVEGIEIDPEAAEQARENATHSPWNDRVRIVHSSVQEFSSSSTYDLIVTNPPFFSKSYLPPGEKRIRARHTEQLSFQELLQAVEKLLSPQGRLAIVLPFREAQQFQDMARQYNLHPIRECQFRSRSHKPVERCLLELSRQPVTLLREELILHGEGERWSEHYRSLTGDFYLKI